MASFTPWTAEGQAKRSAVQAMFAGIAGQYDRMNGVMSLSLHHAWRRAAVEMLSLQPGDSALDVCCGTGDFMVPLFEKVGDGGRVVGLDFCLPMLDQAREKLGSRRLVLGDANRLPIRRECLEAVSVGWGLRNVPDIDGAILEVFQSLKPGGRFVSLDMALPKNGILRAISRVITGTFLPLLGRMIGAQTAYEYLPESTKRFKSRVELTASLERAGFVDVAYKDMFLGNICIHFGRKP